jgi:exonuclease VII large subunit
MKTAVKAKEVFERKRIADKFDLISLAVNNRITTAENTFKEKVAELNGANPLKIIAGGYSKVYKGETPLTSVSSVAVSDDIKVVVADGIIHANVNKVKRAGVKKV